MRRMLLAASTLALLVASSLVLPAGIAGNVLVLFGRSALAQGAPEAKLMQAGPLGDQALGSDNAPVTIIEYASMTCPHCARFAVETFPKLRKEYIDTGKVRYILREFPFDALAAGAFMLARCVDKDRYYTVIDLLFRTQKDWVVDQPLGPLLKTVKQAGFSEDTFNACLDNKNALKSIQWVRKHAAEELNVKVTPTFFINGQVTEGAMSFEDLEKRIDPLLKAGKQ